MTTRNTILLDLDESVLPLPDAQPIARQGWQDALRFACRRRDLARFARDVLAQLPAQHGTVMLGSGDYHHLSLPLIERVPASTPFQVVVLDNHPDNMRFPFGMHCGSWVHAAAALPQVSHVHVLGITSGDIGLAHAWENHWAPLRRHQLTYWCTDVDVGWARRVGLGHAFRRFDSPEALVAAFAAEQAKRPQPTYLSIDKDVFAPSVIRSNWDQGRFLRRDALQVIAALRAGGLVGSDITGEVSLYTYRSWFKRLLSALDGQPDIPAQQLAEWQQQHQRVNRELLRAIAELPFRG